MDGRTDGRRFPPRIDLLTKRAFSQDFHRGGGALPSALLSSAEDSSKSFNADPRVDYLIFNVLILERFPRFTPTTTTTTPPTHHRHVLDLSG